MNVLGCLLKKKQTNKQTNKSEAKKVKFACAHKFAKIYNAQLCACEKLKRSVCLMLLFIWLE